MKSYDDFTQEEWQELFKGIRVNTFLFDDIQFNANCVKQQLDKLKEDGDEITSSTAYHMEKVLKLLTYFKIIEDES